MATTDRAVPAPAASEAAAPDVLAPRASREGRVARNLGTIAMVWQREMIRFFRMPSRIITGLAQPLLFLFVLGAGIEPIVGSRTTGGVDYQEFIFPGVIAMSILFSSLFSAISIVWDREFGFLREMLVAPVSRTALVLGKAVGGGSIAVVQGLILLLAAPLVGVSLSPLEFVAMFGLLLLLAFALNAFGIVIASRMQRMESFQMVMTLVVNPMLFLSGAIFPTEGLPTWLTVLTRLNPVTYGVDPIRRVMLGSDAVPLTWGDWVVPIWLEVLIVFSLGTAMLAIAVQSFRKTE